MLQFDLQFYEELTVAWVKTVKFISGAFFGTDTSQLVTSRPFLKNGGRYCFGVRRRIRRLRRLSPRFASYLSCY